MELRDDQPVAHEFGNRTYLVADVEPLDVDGVRTVQVGVAMWVVGFIALLPFYGRLSDAGHGWMCAFIAQAHLVIIWVPPGNGALAGR